MVRVSPFSLLFSFRNYHEISVPPRFSKVLKCSDVMCVTLLTRMFLSATKTLGAETTPIVMSLVASLRSSVASLFAVSSEYYMWRERYFFSVS